MRRSGNTTETTCVLAAVLTVLSGICLADACLWVLEISPPSEGQVLVAIESEPIELIRFVARSGYLPGQPDVAGWLESILEDPEGLETDLVEHAAWASGCLGLDRGGPARHPLEQEYSSSLPSDPGSWLEAHPGPAWARALFRQIIHLSASGTSVELSNADLGAIAGCLAGMPDSLAASLALEALGRMATGGFEHLARGGDLLRYGSAIGLDLDLPSGWREMPVADQVHAARCASSDSELEELLSASSWAVRFEAATRAPLDLVAPLLRDPVPQVALAAASRLDEEGLADGRLALESLAGTEGPIACMAAARLGEQSLDLLMALASSDAPSMRAAAQEALLAIGGAPCSLMVDQWLSDPYWLVPCGYLYYLADPEGDNGRVVELSRALLAERGESDSELRDCLEVLLGQLEGPGVSPVTAAAWNPAQPLPFDPDTVAVPAFVVVTTTEGSFTVELWRDVAPITCASFCHLAETGFYEGIRFHRVIPAFVAQAGCPEGNGTGGPGYVLPNERSLERYEAGVVGMADAGPDTGGSQFFVMLDRCSRLDGRYTAFGRVSHGMDVVERISVGAQILSVRPLS
ncbi:peptidylprolyl isomerase [Candidatus Fermentibacterales bacterium]|nr:peptidylprolyl isomerase [Candidatus Fermentibacterales bacterium]